MQDTPSLGRCPQCSEAVPASYLLIEYEEADGTTRCFAECPTCDEVVKPE